LRKGAGIALFNLEFEVVALRSIRAERGGKIGKFVVTAFNSSSALDTAEGEGPEAGILLNIRNRNRNMS